jgi:hypothetical protein
MRELGFLNELMKYHCVILRQNLIPKALVFKQNMSDSAFNFIR